MLLGCLDLDCQCVEVEQVRATIFLFFLLFLACV